MTPRDWDASPSALFADLDRMQRTPSRLLALIVALALAASACSATADVTITPGLVEQATESSIVDAPAEPAAQTLAEDEPGSVATTSAATTAAATATATSAATSQSASLEAEQAEKAERRAVYDAFRRDLFVTLFGDEPLVETEHLPDASVLTAGANGDTMRVVATAQFADESEPPAIFSTQSNATVGITHTTAERADFARWLEARYDRPFVDAAAEPGQTESVAIVNGGYTVWSRGLTSQIATTAHAPLDPNRWYVADSLAAAVRPFHGTTSELWERLSTPMPDATFNADGTSVRSAELTDPGLTSMLGFVAINVDERPTTMTTVTSADDHLVSIDLAFSDDAPIERVRFELTDRGASLELPQVTDVLQDPRDNNHIRPDSYSWSATGTSFEVDGDLDDSRWNVQGHYVDSYLQDILTMTAGDAAALAGVQLEQTAPDQVIQRRGFEGTTYTVGLFPEILPAWASPNIDPGTEYLNDLFEVPTQLFPMGLSEYDVWLSLRTVPSVADTRGWNHARVTTGSVDPELWNWRHREGVGFFAWVLSEDPAERFEVTIGADADGRIERFELRTVDPDGSGLRFDVTIDPVRIEPERVETTGRPTNLVVDQAWSEATVAEEAAEDPPDVEGFFAASRAAYPTIDHARRPQHLTLLAEWVNDEPSGAYTPEGEYYRWPSVHFADRIVGGLGDTGQWIVCLELEDNQWRYEDNVFETFWRGYSDGSSLDGLILRYNSQAWMSLDVYGSDGERHPADPCSLAAS